MKIESLREVKANLSKIVKKPAIRKVGGDCQEWAPLLPVLFPVTKGAWTSKACLLAQRKEFWKLFDRAP